MTCLTRVRYWLETATDDWNCTRLSQRRHLVDVDVQEAGSPTFIGSVLLGLVWPSTYAALVHFSHVGVLMRYISTAHSGPIWIRGSFLKYGTIRHLRGHHQAPTTSSELLLKCQNEKAKPRRLFSPQPWKSKRLTTIVNPLSSDSSLVFPPLERRHVLVGSRYHDRSELVLTHVVNHSLNLL